MNEKSCSVCSHKKPVTEFYKNKGTADGYGSQCRDCDAEGRRLLRQFRKRSLVQKLGGVCSKCGYDKCFAALEFHHQEGSKEELVSRLLKKNLEVASEEAEKCVLLCANCHREHHYLKVEKTFKQRKRTRRVGVKHGTTWTYRTCGPPKCDECKEALRIKMKEYRERRRKREGRSARVSKGGRRKSHCVACGADINKRLQATGLCKKCYQGQDRPTQRSFDLDRDELERLVWEMSVRDAAKKLGVSDAAVHKRCKKYGIEKPPRGYWLRQ